MLNFRATAFNTQGLTFAFQFRNLNWSGAHDAARAELDKIVAADAMHQKLGPWDFRNVDRTA